MSETPAHDIPDSFPNEEYLLDVNEVAELLGVTRTRVSQLTSAGLLSFERKRVGVRNRLFYRRSEVLAYQKNYYGRQISVPAPQTSASLSSSSSATLENKTFTDSRAGASGSGTLRSHSMVPEHLYLETARLITQDTNNSHLLMRLQQTLNQVSANVSSQNKPILPSALALESQEKVAAKIDKFMRLLCSIDLKIEQQDIKFESVLLEITALQKNLHHLTAQQRMLQRALHLQRSAQIERTTEQIAMPSPTATKLSPKKRSRGQSTVKKRISTR